MDQLQYVNMIDEEFMNIIYENIPKEWIASLGSSGPKFHARLCEHNSAYKTSEYFYNGEKKFIHWTTVQNFLSIINSRQIRLYNLQSSTDEREFKYAADKLTIPDDRIDHSKNYLYTFSFCEFKEKDNPKLWKEYGRDYSGVAIEFELQNNPSDWKNFMLSQTYYELPERLIRLYNKLSELKVKYKTIDTEIDFGRLIAFHKHPDFEDEKEIRLSSYFPYNNIEAYWKYCNTEFRFDNNRPRITDYFGLNLWVDNESPYVKSKIAEYDRKLVIGDDYFIESPRIHILNIHFGENCGLDNHGYYKFRQKLEEVIRLKFGYKVDLPLNLYKRH